jgi:hypothetical protein
MSNNPLTLSRKNKVKILKECLNDVIDLLLLKYNQRDRIHMSKFKKLRDLVKDIEKEVI